jgi:hypothetical protein
VVNVEDIVEQVIRGYDMALNFSTMPTWVDAMETFEYLDDFDDLDDDELIDTLARLAGYPYENFKEAWESLSDKEKEEALGEIEYRIVVLGFKELLKAISTDLYIRENKEMREKIIDVAKRYVNGEIDLYDFAVGLENILWPTEDDKKKYDEAVRDYWDGIGLADYIEEDKVKEMVKEYLIEELEAVGGTSGLGEPAP